MHCVRLLKQTQGKEELMRICADRTDVETNIFPETLHDVTKVHTACEVMPLEGQEGSITKGDIPQGFKYKTQVPTMLKRPFKAYNMLLIIWIRLLQLVENLHFFQTRTVPVRTGGQRYATR